MKPKKTNGNEEFVRQKAGANSTQIVGDYNKIGLDEEEVRELLKSLEGCVSARIGSSEIGVTESVRLIVESAFNGFVTDIEKKQDDTSEEIKRKINERFAELGRDTESFIDGIWEDIREQRDALGDISAALSAVEESYEARAQEVLSAIDELKELVSDGLSAQKKQETENAVNNLLFAMREEFVDEDRILSCCDELDRCVPGHFLSRFCRAVCGGNTKRIDEALHAVDVEKHYDYVADELWFLLKAPGKENLLAINDLIARAYEHRDTALFDEFNRLCREATERIDEGAYDPMVSRACFLAYKSEDMREVETVTHYLEKRGIKCFVAAKNLPHGKIESYDRSLETAMDKCKVFVFISTERSRTVGDARDKEIAYIMRRDYSRAPEYEARGDYIHLPRELKKPRVEYVTEPYRGTVSEEPVKEFFDGFERVYKNGEKGLEELYRRICELTDPLRNAHKTSERKEDSRSRTDEDTLRRVEEEAEKLLEQEKAETAKKSQPQGAQFEGTILEKPVKKILGGVERVYKAGVGVVNKVHEITDPIKNAFAGTQGEYTQSQFGETAATAKKADGKSNNSSAGKKKAGSPKPTGAQTKATAVKKKETVKPTAAPKAQPVRKVSVAPAATASRKSGGGLSFTAKAVIGICAATLLITLMIIFAAVFNWRWSAWQWILGSVGGLMLFAIVAVIVYLLEDNAVVDYYVLGGVLLGIAIIANLLLALFLRDKYSILFYWLLGWEIAGGVTLAVISFNDVEEGWGIFHIFEAIVALVSLLIVFAVSYHWQWSAWQWILGIVGGTLLFACVALIIYRCDEDCVADFYILGSVLLGICFVANLLLQVFLHGQYKVLFGCLSVWEIIGGITLAVTSFACDEEGWGVFQIIETAAALIGMIAGLIWL